MTANVSNSYLVSLGQAFEGAATNLLVALSIQPLLVAKTWRQNNLPGFPPLKNFRKGFLPNSITGAPLEAIGFVVEDLVRRHFPRKKTDLERFGISLGAGMLGSPTSTMIERPMLVSHRLGMDTFAAIRLIYTKEGMRGFLKGNMPTMARECGYHIGIFACADVIQTHLASRIRDPINRDRLASVLSGSLVGACTTPFDRIKTVMQSDVVSQFSSVRKTTEHILKTEGLRGFTRGGLYRISSIGLAVLIIREAKHRFEKAALGISYDS